MGTSLFWKLLGRGLRQRCPVCGQGKIFSNEGAWYARYFQTYEYCPVCNFKFERESGYYTGAMAVNLVLTECVLAAIGIPLALKVDITQPTALTMLIGLSLTLPIIFPIIFYRPTKSLWMAMDHVMHPVDEHS